MTAVAPAPRLERRSPRWLIAPLLAFSFFALLAGLLAKAYGPSPGSYFDLVFSDTIHMKAWLAGGAATFAIFQIVSAVDLREAPLAEAEVGLKRSRSSCCRSRAARSSPC